MYFVGTLCFSLSLFPYKICHIHHRISNFIIKKDLKKRCWGDLFELITLKWGCIFRFGASRSNKHLDRLLISVSKTFLKPSSFLQVVLVFQITFILQIVKILYIITFYILKSACAISWIADKCCRS